jgi:hypothetical protein
MHFNRKGKIIRRNVQPSKRMSDAIHPQEQCRTASARRIAAPKTVGSNPKGPPIATIAPGT